MIRLFALAAALVMSTGAMAASRNVMPNSLIDSSITFQPVGFALFNGSELLVPVAPDGKITYGPHYTPDAAAKVFWESVAHRAPCSK